METLQVNWRSKKNSSSADPLSLPICLLNTSRKLFEKILYGIPAKLANILKMLISERQIGIYLNPSSPESRTAYLGLPQGLVLSPILFIIYCSDLILTMVVLIQFADDFGIYFENKNLKIIEVTLQNACNKIQDWCTTNGFELSPQKCVLVPFTRRHKTPQINLSINKFNLNIKQSYNYLGVTFDRKCLWG